MNKLIASALIAIFSVTLAFGGEWWLRRREGLL